jgi:hypothetical protein
MVSASDTDTDFTAGKAGGEKTHSHKYGIIYGDFYGMMIMRPTDDVHTGVIDYALTQGNRIGPHTRPVISETVIGHADTVSGSYSKRSTSLYQNEGNTTRASSMEPYVAVYIWRRTA